DGHRARRARRQAKARKARDPVRSRHLQEVLHPGPGIGLKPLERPPVGFRHPVEDRCTGRGPLAHAFPPISATVVCLSMTFRLWENATLIAGLRFTPVVSARLHRCFSSNSRAAGWPSPALPSTPTSV